MRDWLATLHDELRAGTPVVRVVVAAVRGSAPREPGACMLVTGNDARTLGTIGGGHLEFVATRVARELLDAGASEPRLDRFSLGASLGQCCGGIVDLWFQRYDESDLAFVDEALRARARNEAAVIATSVAPDAKRHRWLTREDASREGAGVLAQGGANAVLAGHAQSAILYERIAPGDTDLWLFGAGHVGRALVHVLAPLPFAITWIDSRDGMLPSDLPPGVRALASPHPGDEVRDMGPGAWALVMTHSHDEDFAICQALLEHGAFGWAGVIGSAPKATRFRQRLVARGFAEHEVARLVMPIGIGAIRSKEAAAIAVAVAAQLLQLREAHAAAAGEFEGRVAAARTP